MKKDVHRNNGKKGNSASEAMRKRKQQKREREKGLIEYLDQFGIASMIEVAKTLKRKFVVHCGPTNSGKTYQALQALKNADNGVYLGPLRLLALEVYDELNSGGYPCTLLTGEELLITKGATYVASTIEMCNYERRAKVAVIDECQLITDAARGGHWTKAILTLDAEEIHICTAPEALPLIQNLIKSTGAECSIIHHERLTPLVFSGTVETINKVQPGDALITFSRKGVLSIAASLERAGIKASVIYGALPPASRKEEVGRFTRGETTVVVATDAIGLGISLPIKRVIFCETTKYDGTGSRRLNAGEIKQIAGRAGRYGKYDVGEVLTMSNPSLIESAMKSSAPLINEITIPFPEAALESQYSIPELCAAWGKMPEISGIKRVDMSDAEKLYARLPHMPDGISKKELYSYVCCPVDTKSDALVSYWSECCSAIAEGRDFPEPPFSEDNLESCELKYKALDIKHQMLRRIGVEEDGSAEKDRLCGKINKFLRGSKARFLKRCSCCGKLLPANYAYGMCEECFDMMRW